ncbi:MAG: DUF2007 domain-containing protein [Alphaproteobacteria bacterium]|nr:DUF2007 domain-containing protein [Alphaproteobacteria bacterium]
MKEVIRSNDLVVLSWAQALLAGSGIPCVVLDAHTSAVEGSIGAIARRVMVDDEDHQPARRLIDDATPPSC